MEQEKESKLYKINKYWKSIIDIIDHTLDNIKLGVKNYWRWRKIIWVDKQWDQGYLLTLLEFKLKLMEEYFRTSNITVDNDKNAVNIKRCVDLLKRINEDNYHEEAFKEYYEKYPIERISNLMDLTKQRPKPTAQQSIDSTNCALKENELYEADLEELFTIIRREIRGWWD